MGDNLTLTFLGTGDASGYPHPFCNCENCVEARTTRGKSLRLRSHALINDELLIDLSPDLLSSSFTNNKPLHGLKYVVQTHPHVDHLEPVHFGMRTERFGITGLNEIGFWGTDASIQTIRERLFSMTSTAGLSEDEALRHLKLSLTAIAPHETFDVGPYRFTAVPASHDAPGVAVLYAIELGDSAIFYGTDTGPIADDGLQTLADRGIRFDVVILDHTMGINEGTAGHMSAAMVRETWSRMDALGLLAPSARLIGTHIAAHSNPVHEKVAAIAAESGYEIAYDGMVVTVG